MSKWEQAQRALLQAEVSVGLERAPDLERGVAQATDSAPNQVGTDRGQPAQVVPISPGRLPAASSASSAQWQDRWAVSESLQGLWPDGLARGTVVQVRGSTALLAEAAAAVAQENWVAWIGFPDLGHLALLERGLPAERVLLVPEPGRRAAHIISACVDGVAVVLVGPAAGLTLPEKRALSQRVRVRGGLLLSAQEWPNPRWQVQVQHSRWEVNQGWWQRQSLLVECLSRGVSRQVDVQLPVPGAELKFGPPTPESRFTNLPASAPQAAPTPVAPWESASSSSSSEQTPTGDPLPLWEEALAG